MLTPFALVHGSSKLQFVAIAIIHASQAIVHWGKQGWGGTGDRMVHTHVIACAKVRQGFANTSTADDGKRLLVSGFFLIR